MSEEKELPVGWFRTKLEDICTIIMGQSPPSSEYNEKGQGLPFFQGKAEFTDLYPEVRKWCTASTKIAEANDILLSIRAPVGPTNLAPSLCCIGRGLAAIRPANEIRVRYILYAIRTFNSNLTQLGTGSTFEAVSGDIVRAFELPLAPLAEQHRIVSAIEQQLTRLDAGVAAMRKAQAKLKRYRAAVLKAAVEGKLTEAWRAEHPTTESASILLEHILRKRRAKWEADLRAKGKDIAKVKYVEPAKPDMEGLPELPEGWWWASLDQCSQRITDGTHLPPQFTETGIPFIFVTHIVKGSISFENTKHISELTYQQLNVRCPVEYGDILYSAVGSYGVAVPVLTHRPFSFQRHIAHIKPSQSLSMKYLIFCLNSSWCLDQAHKLARGVAQKTVTLGDLVRFVIPIAPLNEQEQIVAEVEKRLSIITQLEAIVEANLKRAERLRQSILKEAFAGRLVPQDPNDEPASVLLERIRMEREGQKKGTTGNGRYIKVSSERVKIDVEGTRQVGLWEGVGGGM